VEQNFMLTLSWG